MKTALLILVASCCGTVTYSQVRDIAPLFKNEEPLEIRFSISLADAQKAKEDSVYFPTTLHYKEPGGQWDSLHVSVRARGNFRRKYCSLPPLRIKISKADRGQSIFAGTKSLKLVLPCHTTKSDDDLILREYICYKLCEPTTPYVFGTRMVKITLLDRSGKNSKTYNLSGFFIEDDDAVAKRLHAKVVDVDKLHPQLLNDTCSVRNDIFQYMIGNTDFSTTFFHNTKVIKTDKGRYIPIPYDFDMSGFVNAPYATMDPNLNISSVRERIYRGFCRNEKVAQLVRIEYIKLEPKILEVVNRYQHALEPKQYAWLKRYLGDFFSTIKDDKSYRQKITVACRTR
jgi:hypothetical protein